MSATFLCVVQPKVIEFGVSDQKAHRAVKDEELRAELQALSTAASAGAASEGDLLVQPGGGCRVLSRDERTSVAVVGSAVCVFQGQLSNASSLATTYGPVPEDEPSPVVASLSAAELVCHMYAKAGVEMLGSLRGAFTFVLYESKTSRVLAARDGSGVCPLFQARTAKESLVLAPSAELLEGCHDVVEFLPGDYKYGWSATPRRYQHADLAKLSRRSLDLPSGHGHAAGAHGHHAHAHGGGSRRQSGTGSSRASFDGAAAAAASAAVAAAVAAAPGGAVPIPIPGSGHPHPHRTYVVSADDPNIKKANKAAAALAAGGGSLGAGTGSDSGSNGGGGDRRRGDRRRSMDHGGSWRLGSSVGNGGLHAGATPGNRGDGHQAGGGGRGGGGGAGRGGRGSGRPSQDGRTPSKGAQGQQAQGGKGKAAEATAASPASPAGNGNGNGAAGGHGLRVDAPEWKPSWVASSRAGGVPAAAPVAVTASP
ncbi:hypothetical protein HYH03_015663 [Edaphochlamys debaryana]|uniref:Glutamine amidotransferase type-2 domain-containing protein n=1 Tax=Edaphochlamys debaryana TaxID=47281 RepID=A0A835XRE9_9CHLO|nr:hypothetical protein HYH03_015663 [Edaphochlamys debaryana]|eukprot:KAG2485600.1 hypothetical protein HYH03_015663 [Edaphochlamys debaryana]